MSYRPVFVGRALLQVNGLPKEAFDALLERILTLVEAPWDAAVMPPGDDRAFRLAVFGEGLGQVAFHVDDDAAVIRIFELLWIG
ncbi:hypothetical protein [Actinomadura sp. NTSP31]|uniref:hypothetical protein n=1 Tax=Actinomadura sp. NTSP31 TaxID=1735447 RepID=UPI0035BEDC78